MADQYTDSELFNIIPGSSITGESTYDIWKSLGNTGDVNDFLEFLKGEQPLFVKFIESSESGYYTTDVEFDQIVETFNQNKQIIFIDINGSMYTTCYFNITSTPKHGQVYGTSSGGFVHYKYDFSKQKFLRSYRDAIFNNSYIYVDPDFALGEQENYSNMLTTDLASWVLTDQVYSNSSGNDVDTAIVTLGKLKEEIDEDLIDPNKAANAKVTGDKISELKEDLGDVRCDFYTETKSKNLFDPSKVQEQKGIDSSGVIYTDASFDISDRIPVLANTQVVFSDDSQSALFLYGYYKTDGAFVERISKRGFIPTYDGYIVLRFAHGSDVSKVQVEYNTAITAYEPYGTEYTPKPFATQSYVDNKVDMYTQIADGANLIDTEKLTNGYINGGVDGTVKSSTTMYVTDYIPVIAGKQYYYNSNYVYCGYCAFYNANKEYVSGYGLKTDSLYLPSPFTIPDGCEYARFTIAKEEHVVNSWVSEINRMSVKPSNYKIVLDTESNKIPTDYEGNDICIFKKILCIGDSLTDGFFNENNGSRLIIRERSYPTQLQKITGVECTNMGYAGYTSKQWYDAYKDTDLSGHDCCIIQLGVNDALKSSSTAETTQALTDIITKVKSENDGIKIFVATIIPANGYMLESMRVMSETIRTIVNNLNDANVYLVDLWKYGHTADLLAFDSGHLSAYGYYQLACDYKAYISYIIRNNPNDFRYVQFIGTFYSFNGDNNTRSITY